MSWWLNDAERRYSMPEKEIRGRFQFCGICTILFSTLSQHHSSNPHLITSPRLITVMDSITNKLVTKKPWFERFPHEVHLLIWETCKTLNGMDLLMASPL